MDNIDVPMGRELDLRIAREVFGLTKPPSDRNELGNPFNWKRRDDGTWCGANIICVEAQWWDEVEWPPLYSTDIASAWPAVGRVLQTTNFEEFGLRVSYSRELGVEWKAVASFRAGPKYGNLWPPYDYYTVTAAADTAPLAICRAALEVVKR